MPTTKGRGRPRTSAVGAEVMIFRFPPDLAHQLRDMAQKENRSINAVVFRLLQLALRISDG